MKEEFHKYLVNRNTSVLEALSRLNELASDAIVFIIDDNDKLIGSLTDGDIRRGLLKGLTTESDLLEFANREPKVIRKGDYRFKDVIALRENYNVIPVVNSRGQVVTVLNFQHIRSYLPIDAVIMAGGRGERLRPLTDTTPKPLLKVGDKAIIEHNIDRLIKFGIDDFWITIRYLGEQIIEHFKDSKGWNVSIKYVKEEQPLGTAGAVKLISDLRHDTILLMNSDLLTNLNFESFYIDFLEKDADLSVATIPYSVDIPYAIIETNNHHIVSFKEKPTYTYYANGGIYLIKKSALEFIPENQKFDSTDLMQKLMDKGKKVISYPMTNYWLDIGKMEDYKKAQEDIKHLKL